MPRLAPLAILCLLPLSIRAEAGDFGIDFSPLHAPGFGKRPDVGRGPASESERPKSERTRPAKPSPEMIALGKKLEAGRTRLSSEIIPLSNVRLPAGSFRYRIVSESFGSAIFNVGTPGRATFSVPVDYSPPIKAARDSLPAAAAMLRAAVGRSDLSAEDRAFLADQAAMALEGAPLRVNIEPVGPSVSPAVQARVNRALADVSAALAEAQSAQGERRAAERVAMANPVSHLEIGYLQGEKQRIHARYEETRNAEKLARDKLAAARAALTEALKEVPGDIVIRD